MSKNAVREQFGGQAESYVESTVHAKGASLSRLVEMVQPQPEWLVLDIATGTGHTALAFAPYVAQITATDITPQMLDQTRRLVAKMGLKNISTETADAEALPYGESCFDLVTCRIAPHHFDNIPLFLRESVRVLRSGGLLAIVDNTVPSGSSGSYINAFEKLRDPSHGRCLSHDEWIDNLQDAGLTIQHQETLVKTLKFSFWAKRHDATMQSYLRAMLSEVSGETAEFLQPAFSDQDATFRLTEGLFIGKNLAK